jgi:hypothetical protein
MKKKMREAQQYDPKKGQSFEQRNYRPRMGRSSVDVTCPFCKAVTTAYVWSLAGGGKKCECGAIFTHYMAYPPMEKPAEVLKAAKAQPTPSGPRQPADIGWWRSRASKTKGTATLHGTGKTVTWHPKNGAHGIPYSVDLFVLIFEPVHPSDWTNTTP